MRPTGSIWEADSLEVDFPGLAAEHITDVLIIGGGITGISLAALLAEQGQPSTVVEACRVGKGTTGHSTGNLYELMDTSLTEFCDKYNEEKMRSVTQARKKGLELIADLTNRYAIEAKQRRCDMYLFSMDADGIDFNRQEFRAARKLNLPVREATGDEIPLPSFGAPGMVHF